MSSPISSTPAELASLLKELMAFQNSLFDKASSYTRLVLGIAYAGFFAAWSGSKSYLGPKALLWSALLIVISLLLYLLFEIAQTAVISFISIDCAKAVASGAELGEQLTKFGNRATALSKPLHTIWFLTFPASLVTGLAGAVVLIGSFIAALFRIP